MIRQDFQSAFTLSSVNALYQQVQENGPLSDSVAHRLQSMKETLDQIIEMQAQKQREAA